MRSNEIPHIDSLNNQNKSRKCDCFKEYGEDYGLFSYRQYLSRKWTAKRKKRLFNNTDIILLSWSPRIHLFNKQNLLWNFFRSNIITVIWKNYLNSQTNDLVRPVLARGPYFSQQWPRLAISNTRPSRGSNAVREDQEKN